MTIVTPVFASRLQQLMPTARFCSKGSVEHWAATVSTVDAPNGFGDEIWHVPQSETLLAWVVEGAEVVSQMPGHQGKRGSRRSFGMCLQLTGGRQQYTAAKSIQFGHFYLNEALLAKVAEGLNVPGFNTSGLRDDLIFFEDAQLWERLEQYRRRSLDMIVPPSRLEMEARALLVGERLVLGHHVNIRPAPARGALAPWQLRRVCDLLNNELTGQTGLAALAALTGLSAEHFCRAFRRSTGLPPHRWLARQRMERACGLLENSSLSIAEIAARIGYDDPGYFARLFKRHIGATPLNYRRERRL